MGYDSHTRLTPLTTDFHEFIAQVSSENAEVLQYGPFFQWSDKVRQEHNVPMGPLNPQALNRYSYVLNNPLRYVDPTGHDPIHFRMSVNEIKWLIKSLHLAAPEINTRALVGGAALIIPLAILTAMAPPIGATMGVAAGEQIALDTLDASLLNDYATWLQEYALDEAGAGLSSVDTIEFTVDVNGTEVIIRCEGCTQTYVNSFLLDSGKTIYFGSRMFDLREAVYHIPLPIVRSK